MFVEAVELGAGDVPVDSTWTTLPDVNGHTSDDTGLSCPSLGAASNWRSDHPFLDHYQTVTQAGAADCDPTGTSGAWNGATGSSGGWVDWKTDLSAYAGKKIELYITVGTDPGTTGLGVWIDDAKVTTDGATLNETSFENGLGAWTAGPPPDGHGEPRERLGVDRPLLHGGRRGGHRRLGLHRVRVRGRQRRGAARADEAGHGAPRRDGHAPDDAPGSAIRRPARRRSTPKRGSPRSASSASTASGA